MIGSILRILIVKYFTMNTLYCRYESNLAPFCGLSPLIRMKTSFSLLTHHRDEASLRERLLNGVQPTCKLA